MKTVHSLIGLTCFYRFVQRILNKSPIILFIKSSEPKHVRNAFSLFKLNRLSYCGIKSNAETFYNIYCQQFPKLMTTEGFFETVIVFPALKTIELIKYDRFNT